MLASLSFCLASLIAEPSQSIPSHVTVVLSEWDQKQQIPISGEGPIRIQEKQGTIFGLPSNTATELTATKEGIRFRNHLFKTGKITITPEHGSLIRVGKKRYRGIILVDFVDKDSLRIQNRISLEDYLRGVLPGEMPPDALPQALAAQAVAARTYAVAEVLQGKSLQDSVASQVYLGRDGETAKGDEAVALTRGLTLHYKGKIFLTYFHSTCGGHTGDPSEILGEDTCPPLRGNSCGFCSAKNSKYFTWETVIPRAVLDSVVSEQKLGVRLENVGRGKEDAWGRWTNLRLVGNLKEGLLRGDLFRAAVNKRLTAPANLRSLKITSWTEEGNGYRVQGQGWGHGVGMCQIGAMEMARLGYPYSQILSHYYPDSQLQRLE